jgi:hypothetical protein
MLQRKAILQTALLERAPQRHPDPDAVCRDLFDGIAQAGWNLRDAKSDVDRLAAGAELPAARVVELAEIRQLVRELVRFEQRIGDEALRSQLCRWRAALRV